MSVVHAFIVGCIQAAEGAGETAGSELCAIDADHRADTVGMLDHRRRLEVAHHRRFRRVVLGDTERVHDLGRRQVHQMRGDGGASGCSPGAASAKLAGSIHRRPTGAKVQTASRAERDLIAQCDRSEEFLARGPRFLGNGECRGNDHRAGMTPGIATDVIEIRAVRGGCVRERRRC